MAFPIKDLRNDELAQRLTDFKNTDPMIMAEAARRLQVSFDYMNRGPLGGESISDIIEDLDNPDNKAGRRDIAHRLHVWCLGITSESESESGSPEVLEREFTRIGEYDRFDGCVHGECGSVVRAGDRHKHLLWCQRVKLRKPE